MLKEIFVPDIGAYSNVEVIEVLVAPGDTIKVDTSLITLETEKASLEVPSPVAGVIKELKVKLGDKVSEGSLIIIVETSESSEKTESPEKAGMLPQTGSAEKVGETQQTGSGKRESTTKTGTTTVKSVPESFSSQREASLSSQEESPSKTVSTGSMSVSTDQVISTGPVHAGPGVRRFARELGADLARISGNGPKSRILKADVQAYIKRELTRVQSGSGVSGGGGDSGFSVAPWPQVDFAKFGEITKQPLSRIKKLSGSFLHRNWVRVPHVTQFDEADVTELEQFRKEQQPLAEQQGVKLTPLVFIMKAVVAALKAYPLFNASLDPTGSEIILKKYFHIGVAVDTPSGLVVPVVRDVDEKGLFQLAQELGDLSAKARKGELTAQEMQGSSFSISSLGGIGGTAFTPIINVPDVAILGVSKAQIKPVFDAGKFKPRLLMPLSLSYDHRVIDGAEGARFITFLVKQLVDIRRLLL